MPFVCLRRADIPDGVMQVTDLWPNRSQFNPALGPQPQGPRYLSQPQTATVTLASTGGVQRYLPRAQSGLAAYLIANIESGDGAALTPSEANSIAGDIIATMRGGLTLDDTAIDAILTSGAGVAATGVLTFADNAANGETVTIGTKVYTFQTVLTNVDGNVLIGGTVGASIENLVAAITLGAGAGVTYAAATTLHPTVTASTDGVTPTMDATAKSPGAAGNAIATTETGGDLSWGAATLTGGVDAGLAEGDSTGSVTDILRILAGATYTVPAGTVVQVAGPAFNPHPDPESWNEANFDFNTFKDVLTSDSSFYISLAEGQLEKFTSSGFHYLGTTGAALTVYDDTGVPL